jgi:hypothetical protein
VLLPFTLAMVSLGCAGALPASDPSASHATFVVDDASGPWSMRSTDGSIRCPLPCDVQVSPGASGWIESAQGQLSYSIPDSDRQGGGTTIHVRPPRGSLVAPWILAPLGLLAGGVGVGIATETGSYGTDSGPSGSYQTTHGSVVAGSFLVGAGAGLIAAAVYLWAWSHGAYWIDVEDSRP